MSKSRAKVAKGRRAGGAFVPMPCELLSHQNFAALTSKAVKLLMDLAEQLRFKQGGPNNNGDLGVYWKLMEKRGWKSKDTLWKAVHELEYYGFIRQTKQGGLHTPSLYAITCWAINDCGGKLDLRETAAPSNEWKKVMPAYCPPPKRKNKKPAPIVVPYCPDSRTTNVFLRLTLAEIVAYCPDSRTNNSELLPR